MRRLCGQRRHPSAPVRTRPPDGVEPARAGEVRRDLAAMGYTGSATIADLQKNARFLRDDYGYDIPTAAAVTRRVPCSSCGMSKRHLIDKAALDGGFDVVATGHNLDDEAAVLLGNVLHWQTEYLGRQAPVLPGRDGFPRKVKPLVRLSERETAAYCVIRGIDYIVDECPMAEGNRHLRYKEALNGIEAASPGTKHAFYFEFLDKAAHLLNEPDETEV